VKTTRADTTTIPVATPDSKSKNARATSKRKTRQVRRARVRAALRAAAERPARPFVRAAWRAEAERSDRVRLRAKPGLFSAVVVRRPHDELSIDLWRLPVWHLLR
jgi:hypothetical protein